MADTSAYVVSSTDRSALVVISATLFMSWMILASLVRFYIRVTMNGPFGVDDFAALSASVCLFVFPLHPSLHPCLFFVRIILSY